MISSFKSKNLKHFFENDDRRKVPPQSADKIGRILARLDQITEPGEMDLPGYRLHPLKGDRMGQWSIQVTGNSRIIFRVEGGNVHEVELCDYH